MVGGVVEQKERPAYVRFERVAIEDPQATAVNGRYSARDVDMAMITPPGSRDVFKIEVPQWFENMKQDVRNQRMPESWRIDYMHAYDQWKQGQQMPLSGTPIKGWSVLSPAQQAALLTLMILTVEDLAQLNAEGVGRIGMGGLDLRTKAQAWLSQANDKGPLTLENAQLKQSLITQQGEIETLKAQVTQLTALVSQQAALPHATPAVEVQTTIPASDLIEAPEPPRRRR